MTKICRKCDREIENYYVLLKAMKDLEIVDDPDECEFWAHKAYLKEKYRDCHMAAVDG
jgi:hypothetical protein